MNGDKDESETENSKKEKAEMKKEIEEDSQAIDFEIYTQECGHTQK